MTFESTSARTLILSLLLLIAALPSALAQTAGAKPAGNKSAVAQTAAAKSGADDPAIQIKPAELIQAMKGDTNPVVLYVGPRAFYTRAHIPGAEFIGPAGKPEGLEKLRARVASLPKDGLVVIYCGCCPWDHCPNVRPAMAELKKAGFTKVRALYLATSFGVDWKDKGLPVATGDQP